MGFCVRSGDSWAKDSYLSHSFICMTRGGSSVTFLIILLSESALKKEVDRLSPDSQSGPESLLFSQNACSRRHHLCIDTASEGQWCCGWCQEGERLCSSGFFSSSCTPGNTKQGHWRLPPASFLGQTFGFWNFKDLITGTRVPSNSKRQNCRHHLTHCREYPLPNPSLATYSQLSAHSLWAWSLYFEIFKGSCAQVIFVFSELIPCDYKNRGLMVKASLCYWRCSEPALTALRS